MKSIWLSLSIPASFASTRLSREEIREKEIMIAKFDSLIHRLRCWTNSKMISRRLGAMIVMLLFVPFILAVHDPLGANPVELYITQTLVSFGAFLLPFTTGWIARRAAEKFAIERRVVQRTLILLGPALAPYVIATYLNAWWNILSKAAVSFTESLTLFTVGSLAAHAIFLAWSCLRMVLSRESISCRAKSRHQRWPSIHCLPRVRTICHRV